MNNIYTDKSKAIFKNYGVRLWKWSLQKYFKFDKWHIVSLRQRKYARDIIDYCNKKRKRDSFLEIGCGLGDIIRNVHYTERTGLDSDQHVLNAAAFMNKISFRKEIKFSVFRFPESNISGTYDIILMVNWIHNIDPFILKTKIRNYVSLSLNENGALIMDTVHHPEYRYHHEVFGLTENLQVTVSKLGDYERQRQVWIITKLG